MEFRPAALVAVSLLALELGSCVGPARSASSYRLKARGSAKTALSAVSTASLAAQIVRDKGAFATYVSVVLDSAERDVTSTESTFASIQPPDRESDSLRTELDQVLNDAGDAVSSMRIAARRRDWNAMLAAAVPLPKLTDELERYAELPA
jgi:hypothetical protein